MRTQQQHAAGKTIATEKNIREMMKSSIPRDKTGTRVLRDNGRGKSLGEREKENIQREQK